MSNQYYIDLIPFWVLYGVICLAMVIAIEIGRRLGVWRRQTSEDERGVPMGSIIGAFFWIACVHDGVHLQWGVYSA